jgi:hypothetical protein
MRETKQSIEDHLRMVDFAVSGAAAIVIPLSQWSLQ